MGKVRLSGDAEERTVDGATGRQNIGLTFLSRRIVGPTVLETTCVRKRRMGFMNVYNHWLSFVLIHQVIMTSSLSPLLPPLPPLSLVP